MRDGVQDFDELTLLPNAITHSQNTAPKTQATKALQYAVQNTTATFDKDKRLKWIDKKKFDFVGIQIDRVLDACKTIVVNRYCITPWLSGSLILNRMLPQIKVPIAFCIDYAILNWNCYSNLAGQAIFQMSLLAPSQKCGARDR